MPKEFELKTARIRPSDGLKTTHMLYGVRTALEVRVENGTGREGRVERKTLLHQPQGDRSEHINHKIELFRRPLFVRSPSSLTQHLEFGILRHQEPPSLCTELSSSANSGEANSTPGKFASSNSYDSKEKPNGTGCENGLLSPKAKRDCPENPRSNEHIVKEVQQLNILLRDFLSQQSTLRCPLTIPHPQQLYELIHGASRTPMNGQAATAITQTYLSPNFSGSTENRIYSSPDRYTTSIASSEVEIPYQVVAQDLSMNRSADRWELSSEFNTSDQGTLGTLPSPSTNSSPTDLNSSMSNNSNILRNRRLSHSGCHLKIRRTPSKFTKTPPEPVQPNSQKVTNQTPDLLRNCDGLETRVQLSSEASLFSSFPFSPQASKLFEKHTSASALHGVSPVYHDPTLAYSQCNNDQGSDKHDFLTLQKHYYEYYRNWFTLLLQNPSLCPRSQGQATVPEYRPDFGTKSDISPVAYPRYNGPFSTTVDYGKATEFRPSAEIHRTVNPKFPSTKTPMTLKTPNPKNVLDTNVQSVNDTSLGSGEAIETVFACKLCNKSYTQASALKMHVRTHTLPCRCSHCGKSFSRKWLLKGHERIHTGERPYSCSICSRSFADRSNLRAHMQTHQRDKRYSCPNCPRSFSRMGLLNKHVVQCTGLYVNKDALVSSGVFPTQQLWVSPPHPLSTDQRT
ncbi:unnamed protein product [Calicophoron daubneyi]|uniref:C2H2-type domain-containing protein n=1 Tax=Calicophoron daubneyi TaxID=300641 RepID=A0AAV2THM9_CALDB